MIILMGTADYNRKEIIVCKEYSDVWKLQFYKPTGYEEEAALQVWCRVKGYRYNIIAGFTATNDIELIKAFISCDKVSYTAYLLEAYNRRQYYPNEYEAFRFLTSSNSNPSGVYDFNELGDNEKFLWNVSADKWPDEKLSSLKTLRVGKQAFDLLGEKIDRNEFAPVFINKSELKELDRLMYKK